MSHDRRREFVITGRPVVFIVITAAIRNKFANYVSGLPPIGDKRLILYLWPYIVSFSRAQNRAQRSINPVGMRRHCWFRAAPRPQWGCGGTAASGQNQLRGDATALLVPATTPARPPLCEVGSQSSGLEGRRISLARVDAAELWWIGRGGGITPDWGRNEASNSTCYRF